ncbi:hypothetical protein PQQ96_35505 [Paraburkholderia sediminicola]
MPADNVSNTVPDYLSLLRLDGRGFVVLGAGHGIGAIPHVTFAPSATPPP